MRKKQKYISDMEIIEDEPKVQYITLPLIEKERILEEARLNPIPPDLGEPDSTIYIEFA